MPPLRRREKLLVALLLLISTVTPLGASVRLHLSSAFQINEGDLTNAYSLYVTGAAAALSRSKEVDYSVKSSGIVAGSGYSVFTAISSSNIAMVGPAGTALTFDLFTSSESIRQRTYLTFGPLSQTADIIPEPSFVHFLSQVYWTMPSEPSQALALLVMLAERDLFPIRQTFHRTYAMSIGASAKRLFDLVAPKFSCNISYFVSWDSFVVGLYDEAIMKRRPEIVYLFGLAEDNIAKIWNNRVVSDSTLIDMNSTVVTTFEQQYSLLRFYQRKLFDGVTVLPSDNFLTTSPVPGADATEYAATQEFLTEAAGSFRPGMPHHEQSLMMAGWVSATALIQVLNKYIGRNVARRGQFYTRMRDSQNSYVVADLFIGTHGETTTTCSTAAKNQGMLCNCHHAGNNIWFHKFAKGRVGYDAALVRGKVFQFGLDKCANLVSPRANRPSVLPYNQLIQTPVPIHVAGLAPIDDTMIATMCKQTHDVISRLSNTELYQHASIQAYRGYCVPSRVTNMPAKLLDHAKQFVMTSLMGVIPENMTVPSGLVLDFIPQVTQPRIEQANLVYLFPTLDQELYVLASYLRRVVSKDAVICATLRRSSVTSSINALMVKSLRAFGLLLSQTSVSQTNGLFSNIPARCTHLFAIGMNDNDASGVVSYLQSRPAGVVLASFDDLTKYYSSFGPALTDAGVAVMDRFVFATNLPSWSRVRSNPTAAAASAPLTTVEQFLQSVPVELHTPAAVRAYVVAMLYDQLSAGGEFETGNLESMLFGNVSWTVSGMKFGPYSKVCMDVHSTGKEACLYNYGARNISVWSFTRVYVHETELLQQPLNPSMSFVTRQLGTSVSLRPVAAANHEGKHCIENPQSSDAVDVVTNKIDNPPSSTPYKRDDDAALNKLLIILTVCLCVALVITAVLLLLKLGMLRPYAWIGRFFWIFRGRGDDGEAVLRGRERKQMDCLVLQRASQDVVRAPTPNGLHPLTFVCVDVVQYRELWVAAPDLMSRAVAEYQRAVRESIVRHDCYEMNAGEGQFMIACGTTDAAVSVARDCAGACCSESQDATAVSMTYTALGCGSGERGGLRLRIAVHHGTPSCVSRTLGLLGCVRWSGGAVNDAVCAACFSRTAWQVVVTEKARGALKCVETLHLDPLGTVTLPHSGPTELFALRDRQRTKAMAVPIASGSYNRALQLLAGRGDVRDASASALCRKYLSAYVSCCCFDHDASYLTAVAHCLGLTPLLRDDYEEERAYTAALLDNVCDRIGTLLECRHSGCNDDTVQTQPLGVSFYTSVEKSVDYWDLIESGCVSPSPHKKNIARRSRVGSRSSSLGVLRSFAYESQELPQWSGSFAGCSIFGSGK